MKFWDAKIEEFGGGNMLQLKISCSKGSFVRTWADQLGAALGVGGIIEELRRVTSGHFSVEQALSLEELERRGQAEATPGMFDPAFIPMARALPRWKALIANPKDAKLMANGQVPRD